MAILDHLVPAFSGDAYGDRGLLDDLPLGVWFTSTIHPMTMDWHLVVWSPIHPMPTLGPIQRVYDPGWKHNDRPARPDDFRYRVIVRDGQRRVEIATLRTEEGRAVLYMHSGYVPESDLLARIQHQAFANTAATDPKQDWRIEGLPGSGLDLIGPLARVFVLYPALFIGGIYGLSKIANRALPKGKV
jgi:hypothetical protein